MKYRLQWRVRKDDGIVRRMLYVNEIGVTQVSSDKDGTYTLAEGLDVQRPDSSVPRVRSILTWKRAKELAEAPYRDVQPIPIS